MTIGTRLFTWWRGELVGTDDQGNRYFQEKTPVRGRKQRRWVMYNGQPEASRVPPDWHGWLHYTVDVPPPNGALPKKPWQKQHQPNLTGTAAAYRPAGDIMNAGPRAKATGDYEPWQPG